MVDNMCTLVRRKQTKSVDMKRKSTVNKHKRNLQISREKATVKLTSNDKID